MTIYELFIFYPRHNAEDNRRSIDVQWSISMNAKKSYFPFLQNRKCLLDGLSLFGFVCFMQWPKNFCNQRITIKILVPRNHFYKIKTMQLTLHTKKWFQPIHDIYKEKPLGRHLNKSILLNVVTSTFFSSFVILHNYNYWFYVSMF